MIDYLSCPECNNEIQFPDHRWTMKGICPHCQAKLMLDFDFVVMEDDEWDQYEVIKMGEDDYNDKYNSYESVEILKINL